MMMKKPTRERRVTGPFGGGLALSLALFGCGNGAATGMADMATTPDLAPAACTSGTEKGIVITKLAFAKLTSPGVSVGFDLDNYTAKGGDQKTCGHASLTSPDGVPGIDNTFGAGAIPIVDSLTKGAFEGELQDAINSGMLLFGLDLTNVDDKTNDDCVTLSFSRLSGMPTVGTDKILDPNQTFDVDKSVPKSTVQGKIKDGTLFAGPFDLTLPVRILNADFSLTVHNAHVAVKVNDDTAIVGILGGSVVAAEVQEKLMMYAIGADLLRMLPVLLMNIVDQDVDPVTMTCRQFSVALNISAKPAFINP